MEYILNIDENNKIPVFYFHKKITKNQKIFLEDLKHKFLHNMQIFKSLFFESLNIISQYPSLIHSPNKQTFL